MATVRGSADGEVDPSVLERARRGDGRAFERLVRHYDPRLRALAYRLLGDADRTDDALQEAYVKAYRSLAAFRAEAPVGTWLYRIAYNACLDELRRRGRAECPADDVPEWADPAAGAEERLADRASLAAALAALPPDQAAAVVLVDADGLGYAAAAEVLGVPEGTLASRLSRARSALRQALRGEAAREETR